MRKVILLTIFSFIILAFNAYAAVLQKGEKVFARSYLRVSGNILAWHNLSSARSVIPAGTEVKIITCKGQQIVFTKQDTGKKYRLVANSAQWDKYFVKDKNEIGLDSFSHGSDSHRSDSHITKGELVTGMTKEEVYVAKGCPAYTAYGIKSYGLPLSDIMKSDTWFYMKDSRRHDKLVKFDKNVVVSLTDY